MNRAIIYVRVSTEEQGDKGYSLLAQEQKLRTYCKINNLEVARVFSEEHSAWKEGFDRPTYNELKKYVNDRKNKIDLILVTQWSRFSRDTSASYQEIDYLKRLKIQVNAIEQWIDFRVPENLIMLAIYLAAPEVESDRLSIRTKDGMRKAIETGRCLGRAPLGYKNNKLTKLVDIDPENAELMQWCFNTFATGEYAMDQVRQMATPKGLRRSKQAFIDILKNQFYIGKVRVPSTFNEPEKWVSGLHEAIISDEVFQQVQNILNGKKKPYKGQTKHEEIPLCNLIVCAKCGRLMTGTASTGNGGLYYYYQCQYKYGCNHRFRADLANTLLVKYLSNMEIMPEILNLYNAILEDVFLSNKGNIEKEKKVLDKQIEEVAKKILWAEDQYADSRIRLDQFQRYVSRFEAQKSDLIMKHATLAQMPTEYAKYMRFGLNLLGNISTYYVNASSDTKKRMIGLIFPQKLHFENESYQTTILNEVFGLIVKSVKDLNKKTGRNKTDLSSNAPPSGLEPETP